MTNKIIFKSEPNYLDFNNPQTDIKRIKLTAVIRQMNALNTVK